MRTLIQINLYLLLLIGSHLYAQPIDNRNFGVSSKKGEKRIALLVGNNDYGGGKSLKGIPINDINDLELTLKGLDFEVEKVSNVGKKAFKEAIQNFTNKLNDYDVCLFYYSGHGIQSNLKAMNYMIPIGADDLCNDVEIEDQCVNMNYLIDYMGASKVKTKIIFFDACRTFPTGCSRNFTGKGLINRGAEGMFISYATTSGDVALNTLNNRNSPYVQSLLDRITMPNTSIGDMFTGVIADVYSSTEERQRPWNSNNLMDVFYFNIVTELPKDSDGDGVYDDEDDCVMVQGPKSNNGCPVNSSTKDSDGDGLMDDIDKCPLVSGPPAGLGCPDSDEDGIYDFEDNCPNEFGVKSNSGCPAEAPPPETSVSPFVQKNMILVTGGNFTLGCNIGNVNCDPDEFPTRNVTISDFYIQRNEVTNSQFLTFLNDYKSDIVKDGAHAGQQIIYPSTSGLTKKNGTWVISSGYEEHPVVNVTWFGAATFAKHYGLRLPTEAEWEFVAKGGRNNQNYVFAGGSNLYNIGVYEGNSNFDSAEVGSKGKTHVLGVNDMSGNVWEWCQDWYSSDYKSTGTANPKGPSSGQSKVIRSGSYSEGEWEARVTNRAHKTPTTHSNIIGFRCAK